MSSNVPVGAVIKDIAGIRTRMLVAGDSSKPVLFMLHGIGLTADCFIRNLPALGRDFFVVAIDLLGHGFTAAPSDREDVPQRMMARHVLRVADDLGAMSFSICGSSFGALVACMAYLDASERVSNLILVGSGSVFHSPDEQVKTLRAAAANAAQAFGDPSDTKCLNRLNGIVFNSACVPAELPWISATAYANPSRYEAYKWAIAKAIERMQDPNTRVFDRLGKLKVRTRVIVGREDIRADWRWHQSGVETFSDATLSIYEQCGHLPFLEHPEKFNSEVAGFIGRPR